MQTDTEFQDIEQSHSLYNQYVNEFAIGLKIIIPLIKRIENNTKVTYNDVKEFCFYIVKMKKEIQNFIRDYNQYIINRQEEYMRLYDECDRFISGLNNNLLDNRDDQRRYNVLIQGLTPEQARVPENQNLANRLAELKNEYFEITREKTTAGENLIMYNRLVRSYDEVKSLYRQLYNPANFLLRDYDFIFDLAENLNKNNFDSLVDIIRDNYDIFNGKLLEMEAASDHNLDIRDNFIRKHPKIRYLTGSETNNPYFKKPILSSSDEDYIEEKKENIPKREITLDDINNYQIVQQNESKQKEDENYYENNMDNDNALIINVPEVNTPIIHHDEQEIPHGHISTTTMISPNSIGKSVVATQQFHNISI